MTGPGNPSDGAAQPDVDSRHTPAPGPLSGTGIGPVWPDDQTSDVSTGEVTAGGPDPDHPHLFHLATWGGSVFDGGSLQGANSENWPILAGQKGAVYLVRLRPGGVREPHWHPSAWEVNIVLAGRVRWSFVGPDSTQDVFEGGKGDVIFAPQGHLHYFENADDNEDLIVVIVFNSDATEPKDDIGLAQSISAVPPAALAAVFGVDPGYFADLPAVTSRRPIVLRGDR